MSAPLNIVFLNENILGHNSYLPPLVEALRDQPQWGVTPHLIQTLPLPPELARWGNTRIPYIGRWNLDFYAYRWRQCISRNGFQQIQQLRKSTPIHAIVVNTQSAGLHLPPLAHQIPVFPCLDATFHQLSQSPWFNRSKLSSLLSPLTLSPLRHAEKNLFRSATGFFPWSQVVADSLQSDYGIPSNKICILPPSIQIPRTSDLARSNRSTPNRRPQILFVGGDFKRKGGEILLASFRKYLSSRFDLHLLTQTPLSPEPHVFVHSNTQAGSPEWFERWHQADVFVFPSHLETFGIVLLEALAFEVPIVCSRGGAAVSLLEEGRLGILLENLSPESIAEGVERSYPMTPEMTQRLAAGRNKIDEGFDRSRVLEKLLNRIRQALPKT